MVYVSNDPYHTCKMCGKCCYFKDEEGNLRKCKHLQKNHGKTICRIFSSRIGSIIYKKGDYKVQCIWRYKSKVDYPDCPFNTDKPLFGGEQQ